jgi:site-specific recombinase XerD
LRFAQDWLGHANMQNTTIYTFLTAARVSRVPASCFTHNQVIDRIEQLNAA